MTHETKFPEHEIILPKSRLRLLAVDDVPINVKITKDLLEIYDAVVDTCLNGKEAIKLIQQNDYDMVFMDHLMPGMDGIETVTVIRAWEKEQQKKQVPIIALTGNIIDGMYEQFLQNGFNDMLAKPLDLSSLEKIMLHWIPEKKLQLRSKLFNELFKALELEDAFEIDRIMEELEQQPLDSKTFEILKKISRNILMAEYENALKTIKENFL